MTQDISRLYVCLSVCLSVGVILGLYHICLMIDLPCVFKGIIFESLKLWIYMFVITDEYLMYLGTNLNHLLINRHQWGQPCENTLNPGSIDNFRQRKICEIRI